MHQDPNAPPVNPLPAAVVILALPIVLVELILAAGAQGFVGGNAGIGWRLTTLQEFGFVPAIFDLALETGRLTPGDILDFVTYPFVHLSFMHTVMVLVFLLAIGKFVGEVMGSKAVIVIFFAASIFGALVLAALTNSAHALVGGYTGVYGLIGGFTAIIRARLLAENSPAYQAFTLIGVLMGLQLIFGILFGTGPDWIAEIAGFAAGFALSHVLVPGGWARMLDWFRQR